MAEVLSLSEPRSMLAYAKRYLALGWHVLPLTPGTKQPFSRLVPNGVHGASNDLATITRWWTAEPTAGIGVAVLASGLVAVDIDPRNGGFDTMERLEAQHGPLVSDVLALTGGGGEHRVFSASLVNNLPGKLGPGVDLKADGYICVEPSIHPCGRAYAWEASSDPLEGCTPSTLPGWVRDLARGPFNTAPFMPATRMVDMQQIEDLREALQALPADDYHDWVNFGNALSELGQAGFSLWDEWSQKSSKYDAQAATRKWRTFKGGAFQLESIFFEAQARGWANPAAAAVPSMPVPVPVETVRVAPAPVKEEAPATLLTPPGVLGVVTDWVNATARKPQPAFAVQTAIAFMATALGRRFVTDQRNWSSLYLLNIGHSASGKEHAKKAVEDLLDACGLGHLIGPASYTSNSGVLSALHAQPSHITVIDEFGKELEQASIKNNARAQGTMKLLIETWGRCDGVLRPQGYSTFGMKPSEKQDMSDRVVRNPALTLMGMTTPDTFFDTIGSAAARDGFLNRFLIVESEIGPQVSRMVKQVPVPQEVIDWAQAMCTASEGLIDPTAPASANLQPAPIEVPLSPAAIELFVAFEAECIERMKEYADTGLMEMFGRTNEIAMRLALAVACGCHTAMPMAVEGPHAAWAIQYVRFHSLRTVERLKSSVADSVFEASKQQVMRCIAAAGARGCTVRDLYKVSRKFGSLNKRQQIELLDSMQFVGEIQLVKIASESGAGRPREAWVAVDNCIVGDVGTHIPPDEPNSTCS